MTRGLASFIFVAVLMAACTPEVGGPSPTEPVSPTTTTLVTTTTAVSQFDALEQFRSCLGTHGFDIASISVDGQGRPSLDSALAALDLSSPEVIEALADCSAILSDGALDLEGASLMTTAVVALLGEFSVCMRAQGVAGFPDPTPGFSGVGPPYPVAAIPYEAPGLEPAVDECRQQLASSTG